MSLTTNADTPLVRAAVLPLGNCIDEEATAFNVILLVAVVAILLNSSYAVTVTVCVSPAVQLVATDTSKLDIARGRVTTVNRTLSSDVDRSLATTTLVTGKADEYRRMVD